MAKFLFWDFDGTLAKRLHSSGNPWSTAMLTPIERHCPDAGLTAEHLEPYTTRGFPWHEPETGHTHLQTPEQWWDHLRTVFAGIYRSLDFPEEQAERLASDVRDVYLDVTYWRTYEEVHPVLRSLQDQGWTHIVISNHVPELPQLIRHLGLDCYLSDIFNSADIGYEKPHREIYQIALRKYGNADKLWMIGDSVKADVLQPEQFGIPSILVRTKDARAKHQFSDLRGVERFLAEQEGIRC